MVERFGKSRVDRTSLVAVLDARGASHVTRMQLSHGDRTGRCC